MQIASKAMHTTTSFHNIAISNKALSLT